MITRFAGANARSALSAVAIVFGLGLVLGVALLTQPMRYDEAVTYLYFVGRSWHTAISSYPFPNNHVLYTALAKVCSDLTHVAPWAFRLPALLAGLAVVPLTYAVGCALYPPAA